jgi:hypothetical protein
MTQFSLAVSTRKFWDHMLGRRSVATVWSFCLSSNPLQFSEKVKPLETAVLKGIINTSEKASRSNPMLAPKWRLPQKSKGILNCRMPLWFVAQ